MNYYLTKEVFIYLVLIFLGIVFLVYIVLSLIELAFAQEWTYADWYDDFDPKTQMDGIFECALLNGIYNTTDNTCRMKGEVA